MKKSVKFRCCLQSYFSKTSGIIAFGVSLKADFQMTTLSMAGQSMRRRSHVACDPIRLRATITIDIEVEDYLAAQHAKASIAAQFAEFRQRQGGARLEFTQRRPRMRPRPGVPAPVIVGYADD
jgi:hypothetical protein